MGQVWAPKAYWLTVHDGVPCSHPNRGDAIEYAKMHSVLAFRQDANTGQIDIIYEPLTGTSYTVGKFPIARR